MDQVALVTGGSKGIGYACAERLLADGYEVAFCARDQAGIDAAAARLGGRDRVFGLRADMARPEDCAALVAAVTERFGRIDVLVANAGVYAPVPFLDFTRGPLGRADERQPARPGTGQRAGRAGYAGVRRRPDRAHGLHQRAAVGG